MFKLNSEGYATKLQNGFASLQQRQEFVDVTLVAKGHLIKAHQNVLALASPVLKEILQSATSQYPIIFLLDVDHRTLAYILEYVYTGEVQIPSDIMQSFIKAAKQMHITGIKDLFVPPNIYSNSSETHTMTTCTNNVIREDKNNRLGELTTNVEKPEYNVGNTDSNHENSTVNNFNIESGNIKSNDCDSELRDCDDVAMTPVDTSNLQCEDSQICDSQGNVEHDNSNILISPSINLDNMNIPNVTDKKDATTLEILDIRSSLASQPLYCKSIRGNLQMIHNRFMYNIHHVSSYGRKRRWRCVGYRKLRCLAYVDTLDNTIIRRMNSHTHSFHDKEIIRMGQKNRIFPTATETILGNASAQLEEEEEQESIADFCISLLSPTKSEETDS